MTAIWLIYILQISFIPGIVIYFLSIKDKNILESLPIAFGISLIFNYIFIISLSLLKILNSTTFFILFSTEAVAYILLIIKKRDLFLVKSLILQTFISILVILLNQYLSKSESFMNGEDQIYSWNTWAIDWFLNKYPENTKNYPQLLPTAWSLSYVILNGFQIEFLAKSIMPLFYTNIILFTFVYVKKQLAKFLSVIFITFFTLTVWRNFPTITMGLADIPVAFFTYLSILYLIKIFGIKLTAHTYPKEIFLSIIFACGAALTKQAGLFCFLYISILLAIKTKEIQYSIYRNKILLLYILSFSLVTCNYFISLIKIVIGKNNFDGSELVFSDKSILFGQTIFYRVSHSFEQLSSIFYNNYVLLILFSITLLSLLKKENIILYLSFIVPYFFIWVFFYSYDTRNLSILVPLSGYLFSQGLLLFFNKYELNIVRKIKFNYLLCIYLTVILVLSILFTSKYITRDHLSAEILRRKEKYLGYNIELNTKIYDYLNNNKLSNIKISSNYRYINKLPKMEAINCNFTDETYFSCLDLSNVQFILLTNNNVSKNLATKVENEILRRVSNHEYKVIFKNEKGFFIKTY